MKNLVIAVSADSSLELLKPHADIIVLNKNPIAEITKPYETVYIRGHFSHPSTLPQVFRNEIDAIVTCAKTLNPRIKFIDSMDNVDTIVAFEDKWLQYKTFVEFMPRTEIYNDTLGISSFTHPVYKNRLSSRGTGVTWNKESITDSKNGWIIQESLDIDEELRVYVIHGEVYPIGAVKQNMTENRKAQALDSRKLTHDEIDFSLNLMAKAPELDIVGIDVARTTKGKLIAMEVNRSPGFAKFYELTGFNLADQLYKIVTT